MLHPDMATVTVRVVPRSARASVELDPVRGIVVHVRAAPERGRATEEARRAISAALQVAPSRVHLRAGARSRTKVFQVDGITDEEVGIRLSST